MKERKTEKKTHKNTTKKQKVLNRQCRQAKGKDRGSAAEEGAEGRGTEPKGQGKKYGQGEGNMLRIC